MIAGLILAAGESTRMGRDKALLTYRGRSFLENIVSTLREAGIEHVVAVLGHHAEEVQQAVKLEGTAIVVNTEYHRGQTSSLQAGLRAIESREVEAAVLQLVDHPAVRPETVRKLIETFQAHHPPVVIPTFKNRRGHPVVISRALFPALLSLSSNQGANTVMRNYRDQTQFVEVDDDGILLDVDDEESYGRLQEP